VSRGRIGWARRLALAGLLIAAGCARHQAAAEPARYTFERVQTLPHDPDAFTEGLLYDDGKFYESTGLNGRSNLREVDPNSGRVLREVDLPDQYFGEGLARLDGKFYQLTWQTHVGFIYDAATLKRIGDFSFTGEGWGLTTDGTSLVMSDGTDRIRFLDPKTFAVRRWLPVRYQGKPVASINELEWVNGKILANVWKTDFIIRIDPATGGVDGVIDLTALFPRAQRPRTADVLNGIAYDAESDRLFVTGKLWPSVYQIRLVPEKR
jgi:glutamine cyclotransferase